MAALAARRATPKAAADDVVIAQALAIMASRLQHRGDVLTSPQAVRDYLRLRIADREHEVFVALFLDSQNRLIVAEELFRGTPRIGSSWPRSYSGAPSRRPVFIPEKW